VSFGAQLRVHPFLLIFFQPAGLEGPFSVSPKFSFTRAYSNLSYLATLGPWSPFDPMIPLRPCPRKCTVFLGPVGPSIPFASTPHRHFGVPTLTWIQFSLCGNRTLRRCLRVLLLSCRSRPCYDFFSMAVPGAVTPLTFVFYIFFHCLKTARLLLKRRLEGFYPAHPLIQIHLPPPAYSQGCPLSVFSCRRGWGPPPQAWTPSGKFVSS